MPLLLQSWMETDPIKGGPITFAESYLMLPEGCSWTGLLRGSIFSGLF